MGGPARPLHEPGNHRSSERCSHRHSADCGSLIERPTLLRITAPTPRPGARSKNFIEGLELQVVTDPIYKGRRNLLSVRELIKRALTKIPGGPEEDDDEDEPRFVVKEQMLDNAARLLEDPST